MTTYFKDTALALALIVLLCVSSVRAQSVFPMDVGSYWIYEGKTGWSRPGSSTIEEKVLQWRSQVVGRADGRGFRVAIFRGFPSDLAWYEPGKEPGVYALVETSHLAYYLLEHPRSEEVRASRKVEASELSSDRLLFRWPMMPGNRFGDPASVERADGMYVWVVEDRSPADLTAIRGVKKGKSATRYRLTLRTNPDHTFVDFVPGIGITHYTYGHHGTPAYTDLRLVEFGKK